MASGIRPDKYDREYRQAEKAYIDGNYNEALSIIDRLAREIPDDPSVLLLRGHVYCCFERYEEARQQYELVLKVTDEQDFINYAHKGIESIDQWSSHQDNRITDGYVPTQGGIGEEDATFGATGLRGSSPEGLTSALQGEEGLDLDAELRRSYEVDASPETEGYFANPFAEDAEDETGIVEDDAYRFEESGLLGRGTAFLDAADEMGAAVDPSEDEEDEDALSSFELSAEFSQDLNESNAEAGEIAIEGGFLPEGESLEPPTFLMSPDDLDDTFGHSVADFSSDEDPTDPSLNRTSGRDRSPESWNNSIAGLPSVAELEGANEPVEDLPDLELSPPITSAFGEDNLGTPAANPDSNAFAAADDTAAAATGADKAADDVAVEGGTLQVLADAPLLQKQKVLSLFAGVATFVAAGIASAVMMPAAPEGTLPKPLRAGAIGLLAGGLGGAATFAAAGILNRQIKRSVGDLQAQFYAIEQGNLGARASVFARDEFGQLSSEFNKAIGVMANLTSEAQRKAEEQEQAKEDLQRQVIRLLDDVEGAARGDLTVQAEVSADVLGAVADAFNLTIRNLRTIVQQVKDAAREVNLSSGESETFARGLSEDALRQAEELAVTLNSVQMMTDSIQRVAENAQEAEVVARSASETALKGGEAVDSAVAGILQIRETVAQTARKVKRLAESSQEISKIVSAISQIASRTNLLALNASIEAARAGEAGRGFAVIADEVRQLADRSAKSLKEIEKIVLQIQGETSSVMAAMEEGTQQVIDGTQRAEQAKRALEDIIQVSNRIDTLVRSITVDTQEQTETSRSVAQVMQSVEMTAQGTSQESQQVSGALQHLTSLAGDLLASVERFRVEPEERN